MILAGSGILLVLTMPLIGEFFRSNGVNRVAGLYSVVDAFSGETVAETRLRHPDSSLVLSQAN